MIRIVNRVRVNKRVRFLHRKLRKYVSINYELKQVDVGSTFLYEDSTELQREYLKELSGFGYVVQTYID